MSLVSNDLTLAAGDCCCRSRTQTDWKQSQADRPTNDCNVSARGRGLATVGVGTRRVPPPRTYAPRN